VIRFSCCSRQAASKLISGDKDDSQRKASSCDFQRMCFCASRYVGLFASDSRLLFILMRVIWMSNHVSQAVHRIRLARLKSSDWQRPVAEDSSMLPSNSAQLGGSQIARETNSVLRVELRTVGPKSRAKTHAVVNDVDGIYRRINDSATSERIHKIDVLPPQCSVVRRPIQSRTPAFDPQSSTRPPWRRFFLRQMRG
jgi:hypothetical protein